MQYIVSKLEFLHNKEVESKILTLHIVQSRS